MDDTDKELLTVLQDNARTPVDELAAMLDLSEQQVKKRIKKLEKDGVITGYRTMVNWWKGGTEITQAIVQVKFIPQVRAGFSKICKDIAKDSRVHDIFVCTGEYDLVLVIEAKHIKEVANFVTEKLATKKDVVGTNTQIVLSTYKKGGAVFFDDGPKRLKITP